MRTPIQSNKTGWRPTLGRKNMANYFVSLNPEPDQGGWRWKSDALDLTQRQFQRLQQTLGASLEEFLREEGIQTHKLYAFRHKNGGYINKEGGEPCDLCSETLVSYSSDDVDAEPIELTARDHELLKRKPCNR